MAASAIAISSNSSYESVGSPPSQVILFGDIPTVIPSTFVIAPETPAIAPVISSATLVVETTLVAPPTGLCCLVPYLDSDSDSPDEMDSPYEAFRHWCAIPLSTLYPPTTSESSSGDSSERPLHSSSHSAGLSHKRCRSLADSVLSSTPVTGSLAPTRVDLLPPRKRFRDLYSSEASMEEDTEVDPAETKADIELGTSDRDDVRDHVEIDPRDDIEEHEADTSAGDTVEVGIDPRSVPVADEESEEPVREDSSDSSGTRDGVVRSFKDIPIDLDDVVRDFYHHMSEVRIDRIVEIETVQSRLEADQLVASGDRARMAERIYSLRLENLKVRAMLDIERGHVKSLRLRMSLSQEEFREVRRDCDDTQRRLKRLESYLERRFGFCP
ncbi:hypothetical protein Tco_0343433 [Tanacetum coccineum]